MNKLINIVLGGALLLGVQSCHDEKQFENKTDGVGRVLTSGLKVELKSSTRAVNLPAVADFTVDFINQDGKTEESYTYSRMPEIVSLPVGTYTVAAHYGEKKPAEFDNPYYLGESASFSVTTGHVTEVNDPVVCALANVMVTINFDINLVAVMSTDTEVKVQMGYDGAELIFTKDEVRSGYFAYVEGSPTLVATFKGTVEGKVVEESKTYTDVKPGNHYVVTFKHHSPSTSDPGGIDIDGQDTPVQIDANVQIDDLTNAEGGQLSPDEPMLDDNQRPNEDPDDPENPDDPNPPVTPGNGPTISGGDDIPMNVPVEVTEGMECVLTITSEAEGGITGFIVDIDSETLTPDELEGVGLASHLDLVNPGGLAEGLSGLGFPIGDEVTGKSEVKFILNEFLPLLGALGPATHKFILTVTDANGTTKGTLILVTN